MAAIRWPLTCLPSVGGGMLWVVFVILLLLWFLGLMVSYTLGGFLHVLLVLALAILLIQLLTHQSTI